MNAARVIWGSLALQMKNAFARPMFRFCLLVNPIAQTILVYEMFKNSGQENFGVYAILGAGLTALWGCICFSSAGDINRERFSGTLSVIFSAPAGFQLIIFGKILGNTFLSLLTLALSFLTARLLFNARVSFAHPFMTLLALLCAVLCFIVFSTLIAYLLTLSRKTQLYMNLIEIPIVLICGFIFPVEFLPEWATALSYLLPPTWAVKLLRLSVGTDLTGFAQTLTALAASTAVYGAAALALYRLIDRRIRINASLEVF